MAKRDNGEGSLFYDKTLGLWSFQVTFIKDGKRKRKKFTSKKRQTAKEKGQAFLNPDLSVFMLAEHLHTTEDDIIDTIHRYHGVPFGDYIDALRVQHAVSLMLAEHPDIENPDVLAHLAHRSGFLTIDALEDAWYRNFRAPISQSHILN
jgi:transcriptional regulator GlxA family with amidase domain